MGDGHCRKYTLVSDVVDLDTDQSSEEQNKMEGNSGLL